MVTIQQPTSLPTLEETTPNVEPVNAVKPSENEPTLADWMEDIEVRLTNIEARLFRGGI